MKACILLLLVSTCMLSACNGIQQEPASQTSQSRKAPNFVWIISEDNSHYYLRHFFEGGAEIPAVEALADQGLTFTQAYSNSAVCSVARTTLQTGIYGPHMATQFHRAYAEMPMPQGTKLFQQYLQDAGYYVANKSKTDYNLKLNDAATWDDISNTASWQNRQDPNQPFFFMQSLGVTHEGRLHFTQDFFEKNKHTLPLGEARLPPYLPDTKLFRFSHLYYQSLLQNVNETVADVVRELDQAGVLEDTFVFYFSDHGGVLPRSKGYSYDSGLHVPLVVRIPKHFRNLVPEFENQTVNGTVAFVDFAPTLLNLAGVTQPPHLDGKPFLGQGITAAEVEQRNEAFGYADRFDEKYDLVRSLKRGRYHYMRSYQPHLPDGLFNHYRYQSLAYQQLHELHKQGQLNSTQEAFFQPKPVEMLFDLKADPFTVNNLAGEPDFQGVLVLMREQLRRKIKSLPDLGFMPESYLANAGIQDPFAFGLQHQHQIESLIDIADLQLEPFARVKDKLMAAAASAEPLVNYWALMAAMAFSERSPELLAQAQTLAGGTVPDYVKLRAIEYLGLQGQQDPQPQLTALVNQTDSAIFATEVLNVVTYFNDFTDFKVDAVQLQPSVSGIGIESRLAHLRRNSF